jgi:hypothetical protein
MPRPRRRAEARARRRLPRSLLGFLLVLAFTAISPVRAQTGTAQDPLNPAEEDLGIPPPVKKVEVTKYFTEFTRQGPYPYQYCSDLPGEIGDPNTILTARSARCIPVESGELEFCAGVTYDVCSRVVNPSAYDEDLQAAYDERTARYALERPSLATTGCFAAFKSYACLLGFPRCEEDPRNPGTFFELPLCYDYCVDAHLRCGQTYDKSAASCDVAVARGRVAPPRKDVTCVSKAVRSRVDRNVLLLGLFSISAMVGVGGVRAAY